MAPRRRRAPLHLGIALFVGASACLSPGAASARPAEPSYSFAVLSGAIRSSADEPDAQRLFEAIGLDQRLSFIVYDGNLKGADEPCADALYERRQQLMQTSTVPLVVLPGQHDWADCASTVAGGYDAVERLDFLRQTMFSDSASLGNPALPLTRESEVARFHAFRENVRWETGETVFVGLNVVGGNNHYSDAGGRNGEFDDRAIASAFWLEHAAEYAKRRGARALVVFVEGDPDFSRYEEHADRFAWLRFARHRKRDGYLEFKRSLVNAAQTFRGPVLVIHHDAHPLAAGFAIDQPLFNDRGARIDNLTRIAVAPRDAATQWIEIDVRFGRPAPFRVSIRTVPKKLANAPQNIWQPPAPASTPNASAPVIGPLPGIQNVPPAPPPTAPMPTEPASEPPLLPDGSAGSASDDTPAMRGAPVPASAPVRSLPPGAPFQPAPNSMQGGGS
jgi:hypothetical protein